MTRHNMVRDVVHSAANHQASLGAVLEKPGLLLPHDPSLDDRPPSPDAPDPSSPCRRPAGVWVPRGPSGHHQRSADPAAFPTVFSSVESRKRAFLDTASQCAQVGISFCPMVIEAVGGGWSDSLRSVIAWVASESNRCSPVRHSDASFKIAQRISCTLHRENARPDLETGS